MADILAFLGLMAFWGWLRWRRRPRQVCPSCEGVGSHQMQTRVRGFSIIKPMPCGLCRGRGMV